MDIFEVTNTLDFNDNHRVRIQIYAAPDNIIVDFECDKEQAQDFINKLQATVLTINVLEEAYTQKLENDYEAGLHESGIIPS